MGMRQEDDGPPQGRATGDSLSIDGNSKTRTEGQLRWVGWDLPRPHISCSRSQKTALTTQVQKGSLEAKGEWCQGMFYPNAFSVKSILAKRCMHTYGRVLRYTNLIYLNQTNQNVWPNETQKKYPIKVIQTTMRAWLSNSGTFPLSLPVCLSTGTVLFFLWVHTWLAPLLSLFVEVFVCKAEGPGPLSLTTGLVASIWSFPSPISGWEPRPAPSHCTRDQVLVHLLIN